MIRFENKVEQIFKILKKNNQTLCVAESCTGGLISNMLTDFPGASNFFLGSIISYTNEIKIQELQIPKTLLDQKGTINKETAEFMAKGVKSLLKGDWSISITGIMGPEGDGVTDQPVGKIFVSVCGQDFLNTKESVVSGSTRQEKKYQSALFALDFLVSSLESKVSI